MEVLQSSSAVGALIFIFASSLLLIWSEILYIKAIIDKQCDPNPITWFSWSIGAWMLVIVEISGVAWEIEAFPIRIVFLIVIAVATSIICLCSIFIGKGKNYIGLTEVCSGIASVIGVCIWYAYDAPWVAFMSAIVIDAMGALPTAISVRSHPGHEALFPWTLTVLGSAANLFALLILLSQTTEIGMLGNSSWTALIFATYYLAINLFIWLPIRQHSRKRYSTAMF